MECKIIIDPECSEQVVVYAHQRNELVRQIEQVVENQTSELIGFNEDREGVSLTLSDIYCFISQDDKIFALTKNEKLKLRGRLYHLENNLPDNFIKINQSCIANIRMIQRFSASVSGSLTVKFKNGYTDYVSRRNLKNVKERLGL